MERLGPVLRLSLGLVILTSSILVMADLVGLVPDENDLELESRIQLSEGLATQIMPAAEIGSWHTRHTAQVPSCFSCSASSKRCRSTTIFGAGLDRVSSSSAIWCWSGARTPLASSFSNARMRY